MDSDHREVEDTYPLSPLQDGMLAHALLEPGGGVDIVQAVCTLREPLNVEAFARAWQRVSDRHPILRTAFRWEALEQPHQVVFKTTPIAFRVHDWSGLEPAEGERRLDEFLLEDRRTGVDLAHAPLCRLNLLRFNPEHYVLVFLFHHSIIDRRSYVLLLIEVFSLYDAESAGDSVALPPARPFREYIDWIAAHDFAADEPIWRDLLDGVTRPTPVPFGLPAAPVAIRRGDIEHRLGREATAALYALAAGCRVTVNTLIQAAWALMLSRHTSDDGVVFGVTRRGRRGTGQKGPVMGPTITTVPMYLRLEPEMDLQGWLRDIRARWSRLREVEHTPAVKVQQWTAVPATTPLYETIAVFETVPLNDELRARGGPWLRREFRYVPQTNFALTLTVSGGAELCLRLLYDARRFTADLAERLLASVAAILVRMAQGGPGQRVADIDPLPEAERQALSEWNATTSDIGPPATMAALIASAARRRPDALAIVAGDEIMSWGELIERASRLAHHLQARGAGPDVPIGLCLEPSADLIVGMLGILLAGGAYVPLLPTLPAARLRQQLAQSRARLVVTRETYRHQVPPDAEAICFDTDGPGIATQAAAPPASQAMPDSLAYVLFTSGSTGTPKGVAVTHANLVHYTRAIASELGLDLSGEGAPWQCATVSTLAADLGHTSLFLALASAGTVHLLPDDVVRDPNRFQSYMSTHPIDLLKITPSHFQALAGPDFLPAHLPRRWLVLGGEPCPWALVEAVIGTGTCRVLNHYGPTEATVGACVFEVRGRDVSRWAPGTVPIGHPLRNVSAHVLDARQQPTPVGVPGELWIGGQGVARGYLGNDELTRERFVTQDGERRYRTGDRVRRLPTGDLEFLGRFDTQVKIRGHRVELGEIEAVLADQPGVRQAAALLRGDALVGYIVAGPDTSDAALAAALEAAVPDYMVPTAWVRLDRMPLTSNGKVDRAALPAPETRDARIQGEPRDETERGLAGLWAEALKRDRVGRDENFFALGGHSLLAIRLLGRIAKQFGVRLPLRTLFEAPTVNVLAVKIEAARRKSGSVAS